MYWACNTHVAINDHEKSCDTLTSIVIQVTGSRCWSKDRVWASHSSCGVLVEIMCDGKWSWFQLKWLLPLSPGQFKMLHCLAGGTHYQYADTLSIVTYTNSVSTQACIDPFFLDRGAAISKHEMPNVSCCPTLEICAPAWSTGLNTGLACYPCMRDLQCRMIENSHHKWAGPHI